MRVNKYLIAQLFSPSIDDTLSLGDIISRVKRSPTLIPNLYRKLSKGFAKIYGRERKPASLGTANDMPTDISKGVADTYKPTVDNPLMLTEYDSKRWNANKNKTERNFKSHRGPIGRKRGCSKGTYKCITELEPRGDRHKEGLRPEDGPGWYTACLTFTSLLVLVLAPIFFGKFYTFPSMFIRVLWKMF